MTSETTISEQKVRDSIETVFEEMRHRPIPVGISNRHIHLSEPDFKALFPGNDLTVKKMLLQPGHYAAEETVTVKGPKGQLERVRVLGPLRSATQVELSATDARILGVKAPLRMSGALDGTPGVTLISEFGEIELSQGAIVAVRHIHMSPLDALVYNVKHGDTVKVSIQGTQRKTVFDDVAIRVAPELVLEMHIDTDEANAADVGNNSAFAILLNSVE
ncbi:phosphate propanoyltransferase [Vibrio hannami]|uniref:phosphate propanoyltransferase n=1 Tax=Vibrio hannami TaxID=2717094 RepID=UPI0024104F14|nr:phosphate propanoyltransferase [Vibrio hannami]MDG3085140.1 phosphate propanoyltransferase [Vibrio hannami]